MSEVITDELLDRIQVLSALEIDDSERSIIKKDIEQMIDFVGIIQNYSVSDGMNNNDSLQCNVFREDVVMDNDNTKDTSGLKENAPLVENDYIVVPKTT